MIQRNFGLRAKLMAAFALLGLLPLVIMGIVSVYLVNLTRVQSVATMEREVLKQKIEETKKFIEETVGLFEIHVAYEGTSIISQPDQKFLLEKLLQENKFIEEASFIDLTGMETAKLSRAQNTDLIGLNNVRRMDKFITVKEGKKFLGPAYHTLQGPMMTIAAPVLNRRGEVIMVLSGEISLTPLKRVFAYAALGNLGYVYAIDGDGTIIGASNPSLLNREIGLAPWINAEGLKEEDNALKERPGLLFGAVVAMGLPVENVGWRVVAEWPENDAFEVVSAVRYQIIVFSSAVAIFVLLMGYLIGRRIMGPLAALNAGASRIGGGDFEHKIQIDTGDEIQDLGQVFNKMADDLKRYIQEVHESHKKIEDGLKEIAKLKDDFVFVAAHELRSPVTVLQSYVAEILDDKKTVQKISKANPYFLEMLNAINVSKDRLVTLINDLLNVARMEAGRFQVNITETTLSETVGPLIKTLGELGKPRKITLAYKEEGKIPKVKVDPDRVSELLTNLISNAIKYNKDKGSVKVTASFTDGKIHFEVADTGIGLSEEEQKHMFEKFWRSDDVRKVQGTGLGMFIVKHMVEQMGGKISFTSKKGVGSTFKFELPAT